MDGNVIDAAKEMFNLLCDRGTDKHTAFHASLQLTASLAASTNNPEGYLKEAEAYITKARKNIHKFKKPNH